MPRSSLRPLVMPLMMTLVLGVPRFVHDTTDETGTGDYETSSTNPSEQFPSKATRDHGGSSLPAAEQDDPYEDGASERPDSLISP